MANTGALKVPAAKQKAVSKQKSPTIEDVWKELFVYDRERDKKIRKFVRGIMGRAAKETEVDSLAAAVENKITARDLAKTERLKGWSQEQIESVFRRMKSAYK